MIKIFENFNGIPVPVSDKAVSITAIFQKRQGKGQSQSRIALRLRLNHAVFEAPPLPH
jgi:hypothetical protein